MLRAAPISKMSTSRLWAMAGALTVFLPLVACNNNTSTPPRAFRSWTQDIRHS
jgi:hypothetical protein